MPAATVLEELVSQLLPQVSLMPAATVLEELVSQVLAQPQVSLLAASCALCAAAVVRLRLWVRDAQLAAHVNAYPARSLAEAVDELWRQRAAGEPARLVGVFEGCVACNEAPPLLLPPAPSAPRGQPTQCVMQSLQISKETSSMWGWGRADWVPLMDHHSVVPFELCDAPQAASTGAQPACAHVLASGAVFEVAASKQQFTIMHQDPHPLLRRVYRVLRVGSPVAIHGELALEHWMGGAERDVRAVLRAPTPPGPCFFCVHHGGKAEMCKDLLQEARAHLREALLLLALSAVAGAGAWWIWRRRRARAALHRSMIDGVGRGGVAERRERYAPSASPTLRSCYICNARARDCVLLDCRHQVCCLECASALPHRTRAAQPPVGQSAGAQADGEAGQDARCPVCATRVREVFKVYTS